MGARHDLQANPNDPYVTRKTVDTSETTSPKAPTIDKVKQSGKSNVLNKYRSSTYNFTLCALKKEQVNDPSTYRNSTLDLVILKSGGKGTRGIKSDSVFIQYTAEQAADARNAAALSDARLSEGLRKPPDNSRGQQLLSGFNKNSPGRFDMFIDDVEIETLMAFSKDGGSTLPCSFKFKVIEPYSINGFIEALHVSAAAAGYPNYTLASFLLKMEFVGYPDDNNFSAPRVVEKSTRYFPIKFTGIEVEVGEKGTVYRCAAINWSDAAFGQANVLKRPITMSGNSVDEILKNFSKNINSQIKDDDEKSKTKENIKDHDEYEIVFPVVSEKGLDYTKVNDIGKSTLKTILRSNSIFKFGDPGSNQKSQTPQQTESSPDEIKLHPTSGTPPQVQFAENQQINEIISAVVRDSEYVKNILKEKKIDDNGFIEYFAIKGDVFNKDTIDSVSRKPFQKFRYSVIPYKIHYTRIPTLAGEKFNPEKITKLSIREYNYIYTGNNVDVLNFKLNFNTLFFEAIPAAMSNNDQPSARDSAGQTNDTKAVVKGDDISNQQTDKVPTPSVKQVALPIVMNGANASQRSDDPYYTLARNMHNAIIDSKASMLTGDIDILGDPLYLVTGGVGNYDPQPSGISGITSDGEADHLLGEVLVTINFRNPIDIQPLEKGGMFYFETEKLPFSGVYRVTRVVSSFNDGVFKQKLEIIRYPGQIIGKTKETIVAEKIKDEPKPESAQIPSTTAGTNQGGKRADDLTLVNLVSRGLPSPGLPGVLSNFTGALGNLGGQLTGALNQVSGAVSKGIAGVASASAVFSTDINQLASGIRMKASGLIDAQMSTLGNAAIVEQASKIVQSGLSIVNGSQSLSSDVIKTANNIKNKLSVPGSGIGEGAQILVNKISSVDSSVSQAVNSDIPSINVLQASAGETISVLSDKVTKLGDNALSAVASLSDGPSKLISSVGDKISNLTSSIPSDPAAIASKFGINPSQLSGLTGDLQSKVMGQLESLVKKIPEDTNLGIATARGLVLDFIPTDKLSNIPATAPYLTAPKPATDEKFLESVVKSGGPQALANAFGVSDIKKISGDLLPTQSINSLISKVSDGIKNPIGSLSGNLNLPDVSALGDKLSSAKNLLNSVSSNISSVESNIASVSSIVGNSGSEIRNLSNSVSAKFGSISSGQSPLDKLLK